jgi:hypothetical protein
MTMIMKAKIILAFEKAWRKELGVPIFNRAAAEHLPCLQSS